MEDPRDSGDPVDYPKTTGFDNHYHDCDEYWIIYEGSGVAVKAGVWVGRDVLVGVGLAVGVKVLVNRGRMVLVGVGAMSDVPPRPRLQPASASANHVCVRIRVGWATRNPTQTWWLGRAESGFSGGRSGRGP